MNDMHVRPKVARRGKARRAPAAAPRDVLEAVGDHIVQYDHQWRYVFVTRRSAEILGKTPEELLGNSIWELFPAAVGNPYYQRLHEAAATQQVVRFEHYYAPFDKWFDNHIYPGRHGITVFAADITERKRSELALQETQRRHEALVDVVPAGVYYCEAPSGVIQYYNARAAELWGRAPDLARGDERFCGSLRIFTTEGAPLPHDQSPIVAVLRDGISVRDREVVIERPDGTRITVMANIEPIRDTAGRVVGAANVLQDITDRKRADDTRARLAAIVESTQDAVVGKTLDGIVTSWNASAERLFGYPAAEMIGQPIAHLYPPERRTEETRILERIRAGDRVERFETTRLHKSGEPVSISVTVSPVRAADGRIIGASSVAQDIGSRRAAEQAIRDSEQRYRSLVEASAAMIVSCGPHATFDEPQVQWEAYTGQPFDQQRGHGWSAMLHPEDRGRVRASVAAAVAAGVPWHDECRLWHAASGSHRWQEARAVPIRDGSGAVRSWTAAATDVHARKQAEEAVRESHRRKDEFLAVLAHELRNPLAPMVTGLQLLRMASAETPKGPVLEVMDRQMHHLVRLVDDLLDVSRITRGTIELRRETFPLQEALRAAIEISRDLVSARGHELTIEMPQSPVLVHADRVRITQAIANLLNNAAKYTPQQGHIRAVVEVRGEQALVRVADDGIGFEPEMVGRLFEMFAQSGRSIERLSGGLGIGLSLSRRLAELHGGTVTAASAGTDRGSEFVLQLPVAARAAASAGAAAAEPPAAITPRRVLVVDDNRDAATTLASLLRALGHDVCSAHSGDEALALAERVRPEVLLLDLGMPGLSGYDVARRVRSTGWGATARIVAVTGWGQENDRRRTRAGGFDLHLVKPIGLAELRAALLPPE